MHVNTEGHNWRRLLLAQHGRAPAHAPRPRADTRILAAPWPRAGRTPAARRHAQHAAVGLGPDAGETAGASGAEWAPGRRAGGAPLHPLAVPCTLYRGTYRDECRSYSRVRVQGPFKWCKGSGKGATGPAPGTSGPAQAASPRPENAATAPPGATNCRKVRQGSVMRHLPVFACRNERGLTRTGRRERVERRVSVEH
jgi:hypothetical protein